jgi:putative SOS response-associated peptidase YedK
MCTQYTPTRADRLARHFPVRPPREDYVAQAFPGHVAPILLAPVPSSARGNDLTQRLSSIGPPACELAVFGLIPHWSRDGRNFRQCYNARCETIAEKPSFRQAWHRGQWCAVPADAFFEPCYDTGRPVRWRIAPTRDEPLLLAGLWDSWRSPEGRSVISFTLITQNADTHPVMSRFHPVDDEKRSLVLLDRQDLGRWLEATPDQARALIRPFEAQQVRAEADPLPNRKTATAPRKAGSAGSQLELDGVE